MTADAFDDAMAAVGDVAVALLTASPGADRPRSGAPAALSTIVVSVAEARARPPGDDEILGDLDRARAAWARAIGGTAGAEILAPLGPALDRTRALALERAARAPVRALDGAQAPRPLVASRGVPSLHHGVRLDAEPRPIAERAFGELLPLPEADAAPAQKALRRWARDALEELAVAGRLRRPREDEAWTSGRTFEERALLSLDRLASLGRGASSEGRADVARLVEETLHEWSIPDPGRIFAATFTLACFHGHGAAARLHVHARNPHPTTAGAIEDALALGSSPHVDDVVLSLLCEDASPALLERGLRVARRRRRAPARLVIELLAHPQPRVAIAAAQACAALDPGLARGPLEEALFGPAEVAVHAAESLALLHVPGAAWEARLIALSEGDFGAGDAAADRDGAHADITLHAARLRVLHARSRDVEPLTEMLGRLPRLAAVDLLGWLGNARAFDALCAALGDMEWTMRERAAWSLSRITGAGRDGLGSIEVDEHGNPVPPPDGEPVAEDTDRTRRYPPIDPSFWAEPITRARALDAPRLRLGLPLSAAIVQGELLEPRTHQGVRRLLVTELAMLSAGQTPGLAGSNKPLPLDVDDWIARQEQWLGLARDALAHGAPVSPDGARRPALDHGGRR
jgi:hypothetical protein